ncbi:MAG: transporter substrate-binding domain-containing protein [Bacilli bacterium]
MKKALFIMLMLFCCVALTGCNNEVNDDEIIVGLECNYTPYNWTETKDTDSNVEIYGETGLYAEGYDIQIAKLIASDLGKTLVVKKIEWTGLIPALECSDIDMIIAGMSPTDDRLLSIDFTDPYYTLNHVVLVKGDSDLASATQFTDFSGKNIIGQKGTAYDGLAEQLATKGGGNYMTPLDTVPLIITGIQSGAFDATVLELPVAQSAVSQNSDLAFVELSDTFDIEYSESVVSIGIRQGEEDFLAELNAALAKITTDQRNELMTQAVESN